MSRLARDMTWVNRVMEPFEIGEILRDFFVFRFLLFAFLLFAGVPSGVENFVDSFICYVA